MNFNCQSAAISELQKLAKAGRQSILIEGFEGCGKSYLAGMYAQMLGCNDFVVVNPTISEVKSTVDDCYQLNNRVVLCIENLDTGVVGASYALLKFLEEPYPDIFIVVTCRNLKRIPDTIISRSFVVTISNPTKSDIDEFARNKYPNRYNKVVGHSIWNCVRTFKDADIVMMMSDAQLEYFNSLKAVTSFKDTVASLTWKLGHFDDNSECPIELTMRYLMELNLSPFINKCCIDCIKDINQGRIAKHAALAKFCFDAKYCE